MQEKHFGSLAFTSLILGIFSLVIQERTASHELSLALLSQTFILLFVIFTLAFVQPTLDKNAFLVNSVCASLGCMFYQWQYYWSEWFSILMASVVVLLVLATCNYMFRLSFINKPSRDNEKNNKR